MALTSGHAIFGLYEHRDDSPKIDQSPSRLPHLVGNDELDDYEHRDIDVHNDIRLVELLPLKNALAGTHAIELVRIKIHSYPLSETPEYEALSYAYGDMKVQLPVAVVLHNNDEQALYVTPQLMMALKRLRLQSASRLLWIDQLCIKSDPAEKGPQIQLMGRIYRRSRRVHIWVGEDHEHFAYEPSFKEEFDSELIDELLKIFADYPDQDPANDLALARSLIDVRLSCIKQSIGQRRQVAMYELLNRQWFRRAWVFQEASLASEVVLQYGQLTMSIEALTRLADAMAMLEVEAGVHRDQSLARDTGGFEMLKLIQRVRSTREAGGNAEVWQSHQNDFLSTLLQVLRRVQATNPRDLIYAFLSFQSQEGIIATEETYAEPHEKAWINAARAIIKSSKSLDIFAALPGQNHDQPPNLPSWVPNWSNPFPFSRPISTSASRFRASRNQPHIWKDDHDNPTDSTRLIVKGKIIDRIQDLFRGSFGKFPSFKHSTTMFLWWQIICQDVNRYLFSHSKQLGDHHAVRQSNLQRDLFRTVIADGVMGSEQPLRTERIYELLESNNSGDQACELRRAGRRNLTAAQIAMLDQYEHLEDLVLVAEHKQLFMTAQIQLGMAAACVRVGDEIAIIHGSKVPCVMRQVEGEEKGVYRVIAQCYLDGWMYGRPPRGQNLKHATWWEEEPDEFILI